MTTSESVAPATTAVLPVEQYMAGLARKRMAAGVLFRDMAGRVLLVEPSYKPNFEIPETRKFTNSEGGPVRTSGCSVAVAW